MTGPELRRRNIAFLEQTDAAFVAALGGALKKDKAPLPAIPDGPAAYTSRICIEPPQPDGRHPYLTRFVEKVIQSAREQEIPLFPITTFSLSPGLAVIGSVSRDGLDLALRQTGCIYLFVIVPDAKEFSAQLNLVDWSAVNAVIESRGGRLFFAAAKSPTAITATVNLKLACAAPFILDGFTLISFAKPDLFHAVADSMRQYAYRSLMTLGTFYDGCLMLRNSEINLRHGPARIYRNQPRTKPKLPAWVVGSGPSLDADMTFLRDNQEKAVIISCGSALSALLAGGVTPDVHVELENIGVSPTLDPARAYDLTGIPLVAPASVDPVVLDTFGDIIFSFRQNLPNQPLYNVPLSALPQAGEPTVANLGLAFAREQGFARICFFGIDMGARDPSRDHAAGTWHTDPTSSYGGVDHPHKVPANFGGDCYTTSGLLQALHALQVAVATDRHNRSYVNCSDGAAITGADPVRAADLELRAPRAPKKDEVNAILQSLTLWDPAGLPASWPGPEMMAVVRPLLAGIRRDIAGITDFGLKGYLAAVADKLRFAEGYLDAAAPGPESAARMLVRGAVGSLVLFMEYYLNRVTSQADLASLGKAAAAAIDQELAALEQDVEAWIGGPEITGIPDLEDVLLPKDAKFFDPPAVQRNAPCPCGSGKRFKQCHGKAT